MLNRLIATITLAAVITPAAIAQSDTTFTCSHNDATRTITINYPTTEPTPCSVNYQKDGASQTLWEAQNSEGYCEEKANAFVEKQRGWGWECTSEETAIDDSSIEEATDDSPAEEDNSASEAVDTNE